jgi:Fe-S oxidoreductase
LLLAGVEFTLLGDEEWCCGHPYYLAGNGSRMREFAEHNLSSFRKLGVREIIAACPGCYTAWAAEYPEALSASTKLRVEHSSQALLRCLEAKRLSPKEATLERVVYHDPCELGRLHGMYESPRELLRRAGVSVVELEHTRDTAQCCGAGGLAAAAAPAVAKQATSRRVEQMLDLEPTAIVTSCPNCETTLETALRRYRRNVRVLDIVDVLLESVTVRRPGKLKGRLPDGAEVSSYGVGS